MKTLLSSSTRIDHVAIAVRDLEESLFLYRDIFGFELINRREIKGTFSGMIAAELNARGFSIVLVQGTDPESHVTRYVQEYGPGVQHIAFEVEDVEVLSNSLKAAGIKFATDIIRGDGLIQIFTQREATCGMMFEFIQHTDSYNGFEEFNIRQLFEQMEARNAI
ncbi:MAG: hypothetical protein RL748_3746 [Pseudomonadota bacterium]|jgi:methylmalonyl-CoA epimerase